MVFSVDGRTVLTRGMDDTVKREHCRLFRIVVLLTMRSVGHSGFQEAHSDEERRDHTVPSNERDFQPGRQVRCDGRSIHDERRQGPTFVLEQGEPWGRQDA